jgi:RimJ/RimL family protein N-acetyltransferase
MESSQTDPFQLTGKDWMLITSEKDRKVNAMTTNTKMHSQKGAKMEIKIRPWRMTDAKTLTIAINNRKVQDNLRDGIPYPYKVDDAKAYISSTRKAKKGSQYAWAITVDDVAIGSIGISRKDNIHRFTGEIGYFISEEWWGKGIGTKAVKDVCNYVFDHTDIIRIFGIPFAFNIGSCRILEKAGFVLEGTMRKNGVKNGKVIDTKLYALVKE